MNVQRSVRRRHEPTQATPAPELQRDSTPPTAAHRPPTNASHAEPQDRHADVEQAAKATHQFAQIAIFDPSKKETQANPMSLPAHDGEPTTTLHRARITAPALFTRPQPHSTFNRVQLHTSVPPTVQPKLTVNQPGDVYEQEADRVADQVVGMTEPSRTIDVAEPSRARQIQRCDACGGDGSPNEPLCPTCAAQKDEQLQAKETPGATPVVTPTVEREIQATRGGGQALDPTTRTFMEPRFGHSFADVRVHTDARAVQSAQAVNALAYTVGRDVVFGAGQYQPGSRGGRKLLAHELTHVVQQTGGGLTSAQKQPLLVNGQLARLYRQVADPSTNEASSSIIDSEGNAVSRIGDHQYLTTIPPDIVWHKGKAEALPPNPKAKYAELYAQCEAIRAEQLAVANSLRGDMKYWFAKVYHFVTKHELMQIDAHIYQYPLMKMQEVIAFHTTYQQNLENWRAGNKDKVESNWRAAFSAADKARAVYKTKALEIMDALLPSMQAHIRFDLPRAIAACFESNYAGIPGLSLNDFHADYDAMGSVFDAAQADLQPEIDEAAHWIPSIGLGLDPTNWHWAQSLGFPFVFLTSLEREHSWEKTTDIVSGHKRGITDQRRMNNRLRTYATARHPLSYTSDFEVDDNGLGNEEIKDYDWNHQPS